VERSHIQATTGILWWLFVTVCPLWFGAWKIVGVLFLLCGVYVLGNCEMEVNGEKKITFFVLHLV
jgi:hypothetical protein